MRAGIIAANNIRYSPYIFFYTDILKQIDIQYELIIPDRNGLDETFDSTLYTLPWNQAKPTILNYVKYSNGVRKILHKNQYDVLIVLTSINAAFLGTWLKKHYSKRYIVDIRDYTHENIYPYYLLEKEAVEYSLLNVISSQKFTTFLPKTEYHVCHNYDEKRMNEELSFQRKEGIISIGYVGGLSYVDQCSKLMRLISQDSRFSLDFYGTSKEETALKETAKEIQCERIKFYGAYLPDEKEGILKKVDILFNAYGHGIPLLDCALSNKLYDALIYRKPILTCNNTYMTEMAGPLAFPIELSDKNALNDLYNWYQSIDAITINEYAAKMIESIEKENRTTKQYIADSILSLKTGNKHGL